MTVHDRSISHKREKVKGFSMKNLSNVKIGAMIPDKDVDRLNRRDVRPLTVSEVLIDTAVMVAVVGADRVLSAWGLL